MKDLSPKELPEAYETLYIDDREMQFLKEKGKKVETITRQLLLFEFSQIIDEWPEDELNEMMSLYDLTAEEKKTIILDLYSPYKKQVINPTSEFIQRSQLIKNKIIDDSIEVSDLTDLERLEIENKRNKLIKIFSKETKDEIMYLSHYENGVESIHRK